jgi:hypothetical protein
MIEKGSKSYDMETKLATNKFAFLITPEASKRLLATCPDYFVFSEPLMLFGFILN